MSANSAKGPQPTKILDEVRERMILPQLVKKVFSNTISYRGLQKFLVYLIANIFSIRPNRTGEAGIGGIGKLAPKDLKLMWELSKDDYDLFQRFQKIVMYLHGS